MASTEDKEREAIPWYLGGPAVFFGVTILSLIGGLVTFEYESENMTENEEQTVAKQLTPGGGDSDNRRLQELSQFLKESAGAPIQQKAWYKHIKRVETDHSAVVVITDLSTGDYGETQARTICGAVSNFVGSRDNKDLGLDSVRVTTEKRGVLMAKSSGKSSCE